MRQPIALLLMIGVLMSSSCFGLSDAGAGGNEASSERPLAGMAQLARSFGNRVPANEDMIRLMKLPTDNDGKYYIWQLGVSPKDHDVRAYEVADKGEMIILMRINTLREEFERFSHLMSARGELRCTVYTNYGSKEQHVIGPDDPTYQNAVRDFNAQVNFWTSREAEIKAKFPSRAPRQGLGEWLDLR